MPPHACKLFRPHLPKRYHCLPKILIGGAGCHCCCKLQNVESSYYQTKYAGRDSLPPRLLAQIAEEEVALTLNDNGSRRNGLAEVIKAVLGLLV